MLEDGPLYSLEELDPDEDGADVELGFSDLAAHPYHALVEATVDVLAGVPGVVAAWHEDREVILVRAPGVAAATLAEAVDRFWLDALTRTAPDPSYGWEPDRSRLLPVPTAPAPRPEPWPAPRGSLRESVSLPPSRGRMWTYLVCGAVPTVGGLLLALTPGGSNGAIPLVLGVVNLAVGTRIGLRRRALGL